MADFYKSYGVSQAKECFPYSWFTDLDKLHHTELPNRTKFYSVLTKKMITEDEWKMCDQIWKQQNMKSFADYVRYYNDADVTGMIEAIEKMAETERANGLDFFKESISLPGLTQRYSYILFRHFS